MSVTAAQMSTAKQPPPPMTEPSVSVEPVPDDIETVGQVTVDEPRMTSRNVGVMYGEKMGIEHVSLDVGKNEVLAMIGPSGCGKSTFLRCLNRMNDTVDICRVSGSIKLDGEDIHDPRLDPVQLRARVGMVFQKPNPFPKSIYDNVAYGPKAHRGLHHRPIRLNANAARTTSRATTMGGEEHTFKRFDHELTHLNSVASTSPSSSSRWNGSATTPRTSPSTWSSW